MSERFVWSHPWHGQKTNDILAIFLLIRSFLISVKQMLVYFFRCFPLLRLCTVFLWPLRGYFWPWHLRRIHAKANTSQNYWVDSGLVVLNNNKKVWILSREMSLLGASLISLIWQMRIGNLKIFQYKIQLHTYAKIHMLQTKIYFR